MFRNKKKEVDNHNFEAFESKWMHLKILGWKLQRIYCCWEWRIYNKVGYGYKDKMRRKKHENNQSIIWKWIMKKPLKWIMSVKCWWATRWQNYLIYQRDKDNEDGSQEITGARIPMTKKKLVCDI